MVVIIVHVNKTHKIFVVPYIHVHGCMHPQKQTKKVEYSQVERHRFLIPTRKGSNPFTPKICYCHEKLFLVKKTFCLCTRTLFSLMRKSQAKGKKQRFSSLKKEPLKNIRCLNCLKNIHCFALYVFQNHLHTCCTISFLDVTILL